MSSTNPFETSDPLYEDGTEVLFPGVPSLNKVQTNPPRNYEMTPMTINPVTGYSYAPTSADRMQPTDPTQWGKFTAEKPTDFLTSGPLTHFVGDTSGPTAPPTPSHDLRKLYPQIHQTSEIENTHSPQLHRSVSGEVVRKYSHYERYKDKIDQAKNEIKNYINDLHHMLNDHYDKLVEELDYSYEKNLSIIKEQQEEIQRLDKIESDIIRTEGDSNTNEKLKEVLTEKKRDLETGMIPLTRVEVCYNPELLGDLKQIINVVTCPTVADDSLDKVISKIETRTQATREEQTEIQAKHSPESTPPQIHHRGNTHHKILPPGPIIHNIQLGTDVDNLLDPTGLVIDRKNNDVIYVADKEKHRIQVYDRSGHHLNTIVHGEEMRYPHSVDVSEKYLFALCAANSHEFQYLLKFHKIKGTYLGKRTLKDIRHIPLSVDDEKIYMATHCDMVEVFNLDLNLSGKIDIKLDRRISVKNIFGSRPEIRDICVKKGMLYLLVLNAEHSIQRFSLEGDLDLLLAPIGELNEPRYFTVDNRGTVFVTEEKEGRVKEFRTNGKFQLFSSVEVEGNTEKIVKPMGIDVDSKGKIVMCCTQRDWVLKEL